MVARFAQGINMALELVYSFVFSFACCWDGFYIALAGFWCGMGTMLVWFSHGVRMVSDCVCRSFGMVFALFARLWYGFGMVFILAPASLHSRGVTLERYIAEELVQGNFKTKCLKEVSIITFEKGTSARRYQTGIETRNCFC
jgi:hypothetical protein